MSQWKLDSHKGFAIKGVENKKDVKYMKEVTDKLTPADEVATSPENMKHLISGREYNQDQVQVTSITFKYLERLYLLMKASKAHNLDIYVQDDMPLKALAYDQRTQRNNKGQVDKTDRGKYIMAPYEPDSREKRRKNAKTIAAL